MTSPALEGLELIWLSDRPTTTRPTMSWWGPAVRARPSPVVLLSRARASSSSRPASPTTRASTAISPGSREWSPRCISRSAWRRRSTGDTSQFRRWVPVGGRCSSPAGGSWAVRVRSTAWCTCAATAPTSTPGPLRATRVGQPMRSTLRTRDLRTSRTARTRTAEPGVRSR